MSFKSKFVKSLATLAAAVTLPATSAVAAPLMAPAPTQVAAQAEFSDNFTDKMVALQSEIGDEDPNATEWLQIFILSFRQIIIIVPQAQQQPEAPTEAFSSL